MDIFSVIKTIILEETEYDKLILSSTYLQKDIMLDSLNLTRLIVTLEERMNIEIDMGLLMHQSLETVDDLCNLMKKSIEQGRQV